MNRYEVFVKVIECGSFTRAAEELGYTQSAVSQLVHTLEEELSTVLLRREKSGVELSPDGEEYMPFIRSICSAHSELRVKCDEMRGNLSGIIKVGTFTTVSRYWLPRLISEFRKKYPFVQFELLQSDYKGIEKRIRGGFIDCGFTCYKEIKGLSVTPLREDELLAVVPVGHRLAERTCVTLEELAAEPFILLDEGEWSISMDAFRAASLSPDIQYKVTDDYTVISMVEEGLGVSLLYESVLKSEGIRVKSLRVTPPPRRTTALACRNKNTLSATARRFIDFVAEYFRRC